MSDEDRLVNVRRELELLHAAWRKAVNEDDTVRRIDDKLKAINQALWEIEDDIRDKEHAWEFGQVFIGLARSVYVTNDQRAKAQKAQSLRLGPEIVDEKPYKDYQ